jgi:hypothetical protein
VPANMSSVKEVSINDYGKSNKDKPQQQKVNEVSISAYGNKKKNKKQYGKQ